MERLHRLARLLGRAIVVTIRDVRQDGFLRTALRAIRTFRAYGLVTAVRRAQTAGGHWSWYRLELSRGGHLRLPPGMELSRARAADVALYEQLEPVVSRDTERRMKAGGVLWLVVSEGRPVFGCWTFTERSPTGQANDGWLGLPPRTAHIKDFVTADTARGRGIAPAAIAMIGDALAREGVASLLSRVEDGNAASRRTLQKLGFVSIRPGDPEEAGLARQLGLRHLNS